MEKNEPSPHRHDGPGCGVALYVFLLGGICLIGLAGIVFSSMGLLNSEPNEIRHLVHGSEVSVWRLQPMRDAGLLELTEVPGAWHDESVAYDGTDSCALTKKGVCRLHKGVGQTVAYEDMSNVGIEARDDGGMWVVVTSETDSLRCGFGPREGGDRFARQLLSEQDQSTD